MLNLFQHRIVYTGDATLKLVQGDVEAGKTVILSVRRFLPLSLFLCTPVHQDIAGL